MPADASVKLAQRYVVRVVSY